MSVFARLQELPSLGTRESPQLDFKGVLDRVKETGKPDYFELAKDVASMASVYGGTLLIGACEDSRTTGQLVSYKPLSEVDAHAAIDAYQKAVRDRCLPQPLIDPQTIAHRDGFVVAINVYPVLDRPVAVRVTAIEGDRFGKDAYVFPVRLSTHAIPFTAEQLPMLMNPAIRRIVILIEQIPKAEREQIWLHYDVPNSAPGMSSLSCFFDPSPGAPPAINLDENTLRLLRTDRSYQHICIPLDDIEAVWKNSHGKWSLRLLGYVEKSDYRPRAR